MNKGVLSLLAALFLVVEVYSQNICKRTVIDFGTFPPGGYLVEGTATLTDSLGTLYLTLSNDFSTNPGPDLHLYLSINDAAPTMLLNTNVEIAPLSNSMGGQSYVVPGNYTIDDFDYVLVHCKQYNHFWDGGLLNPKTCNNISTSSNINVIECNSYTSPSGNYIWNTSGTYTDTLMGANSIGGDSIITINLSINSSQSIISPVACDSYISPSGTYLWTSSGSYRDTIFSGASAGCDSIIMVNLSIENSYSTIDPFTCGNYSSPSGRYQWTSSGTYKDTLYASNSKGCDSIITINLTVSNNFIAPVVNVTVCGWYVSPINGETYVSSTTLVDTLSSINGCDSIITTDLTVQGLSTDLTISSGNVITATDSMAAYQWLDCSNNYEAIVGETAQNYSPTETGSFAVEITLDQCKDTSACLSVIPLGIVEKEPEIRISVYPNPSIGTFTIESSTIEPLYLEIRNSLGQLILHKVITSNSDTVELNTHEKGIYLLRFSSEHESISKRLIIE